MALTRAELDSFSSSNPPPPAGREFASREVLAPLVLLMVLSVARGFEGGRAVKLPEDAAVGLGAAALALALPPTPLGRFDSTFDVSVEGLRESRSCSSALSDSVHPLSESALIAEGISKPKDPTPLPLPAAAAGGELCAEKN